MKIQTRRVGGVCVVKLSGKLAHPDGTAELRKKIKELDTAGQHDLVLDLRDVPWVDSSGLGEVVACYTRAQDLGGDVKLVLPEEPLSAFSYTQMEQLFAIFDTTEEAISSFSS